MIRRFNYTGRKKIERNRVDISLLTEKAGRYFKARLNLDGLDFPPEAKVFIEPNYKGVYQRFAYGTVGLITEPRDTMLTELPESELVFFDITIVDEAANNGLILGKAKGIPASNLDLPSDRIPLLYVNLVDLKDQLWRLTFEPGNENRPILEINNKIPDPFNLAKNDKKFISLVYPIAFRGVLTKLIQEGDYDIESDNWKSDWIKFVSKVLLITRFPEEHDGHDLTPEQETWIDDCVNEYCKKFKIFEKFTEQ